MALVKCSECGKEISSNAESCPNCGNPMRGQSSDVQGGVRCALRARFTSHQLLQVLGVAHVPLGNVKLGNVRNATEFCTALAVS